MPAPRPAALAPHPTASTPSVAAPAPEPEGVRPADGSGKATVTGVLQRWGKVTLTLDGPFAREKDTHPNPFTDLRMTVTFTHSSGSPKYRVPGYFAADGDAANTSAEAGTRWRAHLSPDKPGKWSYEVSFVKGPGVALEATGGESLRPYDGVQGNFTVGDARAAAPDLRAQGRLEVVGKHQRRFAGSNAWFMKAGPDAPETLLGYVDFDGTEARKANVPLKTWAPHAGDWKKGDPTWKGDKGKGLIGALNYLATKGMNTVSFLTYSAGGDGDNVWPFVSRDDKLHYDTSKLDQWGIVFDHANRKGLQLHFKLQETENDDDVRKRKDGKASTPITVALDKGDTGPERKLYLRELIARYGHLLALTWNLGEENTQTTAQQKAMAAYIRDVDPYGHLRVIHSFPNEQDLVYEPLLGDASPLTGASLQNGWDVAHKRTLKWVRASAKSGKPWVVSNDEQGGADTGVPPDPGYKGFEGKVVTDKKSYDLHDVRKRTLWGTLMAGGAGVEYYFGYKLPESDLVCEDYRSRDRSWDYARIALGIFKAAKLPFAEMENVNALVGNSDDNDEKYALAKPGEVYAVYLATGGTTELDLSGAKGTFSVEWWNPRSAGPSRRGSVAKVEGGTKVSLGQPPTDASEDWLAVVRRR